MVEAQTTETTLAPGAVALGISEEVTEAIAYPGGVLTAQDQEYRQQLRLKLLEQQAAQAQKRFHHQRLSLIFGFILAVMAMITGSLIILLDRQTPGAIAGLSVIGLGMTAFWVSQFHRQESINYNDGN